MSDVWARGHPILRLVDIDITHELHSSFLSLTTKLSNHALALFSQDNLQFGLTAFELIGKALRDVDTGNIRVMHAAHVHERGVKFSPEHAFAGRQTRHC